MVLTTPHCSSWALLLIFSRTARPQAPATLSREHYPLPQALPGTLLRGQDNRGPKVTWLRASVSDGFLKTQAPGLVACPLHRTASFCPASQYLPGMPKPLTHPTYAWCDWLL